MIFKTITTDLDGAINKIGIFSRSFADLKNSISIQSSNGTVSNGISGLFNSVSLSITDKDILNIKEYNRLVGEEGVSSQTAWYRTMTSSSEACQDLFNDENNLIQTENGAILSTETLTYAQNKMTLSAKAGQVALKGLAIAGNMVASFLIAKGIQLAVKAIDDYVHAVENATDKLNGSISSFKESNEEVKSLENQLTNIDNKINEINSLGGAKVTRDGELSILEQEKQKLNQNLAIAKELNLENAKTVARDAGNLYNAGVDSKYKKDYTYLVNGASGAKIGTARVNPAEELRLAMNEYNDLMNKYQVTSNESYKQAAEEARTRAAEMVVSVQNTRDAYLELEGYGYNFLDYEKQMYEESKKTLSDYNNFLTHNVYSGNTETGETTPAAATNDISTVFNIADEETSKSIDAFQEKLNTLATAIDKVKNKTLTGSELLDLQQEFPTLIDSTDDLDVALTKLVDTTLTNVINTLQKAGASDSLVNLFRQLADEAKGLNAADWNGTFSVFDEAESKMQSLADFSEALGDSFSITADEARKFAEVFPELLSMGQLNSEGLIEFNRDIVNDFINGKETEIKADKEAQIQKLQNKKAELEAQKEVKQAELLLLESGANEEVNAENQKADAIAEARDLLIQHLIDLGVEEANADAAVKELMAGNITEYDRIVSEVSSNVRDNLSNSAGEAAANVNISASSMIDALYSVGKQAAAAAKSILSIGTENPFEAVKEGLSGVGGLINDFSAKDVATEFKRKTQELLNVDKFKGTDKTVEIKADISGLDSAIKEIDSQINLLQSQGEKGLSDYLNGSGGSGGSSGSGSETSGQEEYYDWLSTALEKAASQNDKIREQVDDENNSYSERLSLQQQLLANNQQELELLKIANQRRVEGWEAAKQKILETFGEIEGNQLIQNIMSGNSKEGEWFSNIVGDEKKKVVDDAIQANKDLEESNDEITEKEKENAEDIQKEFEMRKNEIKSLISEVETAMDSIQSSMSIRETSGSEIITEADYRSLIRQSKEQISLYEEQLDVLYEQRDSLEENSAEWYGIQSEIASVEASINDCKEAQAEWNEEIKKLPVKRIERYLELLENIKKDITNFQAEQDVLGISSTKEQLQELISISEQQIKKLLEQHALLTKNLDTYTYGTDKFNECSNEIQAVEDNISELIQQMREYNNQILQIPINRISELNEKLNNIKDAMSAVSDDYDTTVNTVVDAIDHEIDSLNNLIEAEEKAADEKIKPLQEQLDLLEKQNEAREVQLGLEQAQWDLERAKNQKTNKVVRDGEIQYEADQSKVRDAEQNLADKQLAKTKWEIQTQIDSIEEARDKMIEGYNEEIDRLTEISKKWEEIKHNIEDSMNAATATETLGGSWLDKVLSGNDQDIFNKFVKEFTDIETQKALYEKQIQENERVSSLMQQYIESFNNGSMSYEEVIKQFNALQNAAKDGFSSKEYLNAQLGITGSKDTSTAIKDVQNDVLKSYSDFKSYLDVVNKNTNTIASYTSTWEQIRDAVVEQLEMLKKLAEEEAKKVAAATSSSSSGRKSSGGGSGRKWDSRDENNGPGAEINAKKANGTYSSSSSSSSSSPSGPASDPDLKKKKNRSSYKVGIENGFVGENNTSVGDMIKILALEKLDPDEIPVIAHKREGIFNQEQMETIVGNFKNALFSPTVKTVGTPTIVKQPTNINIEMGDFNLPNVKNGEEFAAYLKQNFALLMKQEISKAFK